MSEPHERVRHDRRGYFRWDDVHQPGRSALAAHGQAIVAELRSRGIEPGPYMLTTYAEIEAWAQAVSKSGTTDAAKVAASQSLSTIINGMLPSAPARNRCACSAGGRKL